MTFKRKVAIKKTNIKGNAERPRLSVFRSNKFIFVQIIDDEQGCTIASASSLKMKNAKNIDAAKEVGKLAAQEAIKKSIKRIVFDRGRYQYKGRVKALAESLREEGLEF